MLSKKTSTTHVWHILETKQIALGIGAIALFVLSASIIEYSLLDVNFGATNQPNHHPLPIITNEGTQKQLMALKISRTASSAAQFVLCSPLSHGYGSNNCELNWTDTEDIEYRVPMQ